MRIALPCLVLLLLIGCGSKEEPKPEAAQQQKEQKPKTDQDFLSDVAKDPSVPAAGLRTIEETKRIEKLRKEQVKDGKEAQEQVDNNQ